MSEARLSEAGRKDEKCGEGSADGWAGERAQGIAPIRVALTGDGQDRMGASRPEVSGWVDCVARGAAQRQSDTSDDHADAVGYETSGDGAR